MVADFARDLADGAITPDAPSDQFMSNSAADEEVRPRAVDQLTTSWREENMSKSVADQLAEVLVAAGVNYSVFHGKVRPDAGHY